MLLERERGAGQAGVEVRRTAGPDFPAADQMRPERIGLREGLVGIAPEQPRRGGAEKRRLNSG